MVRTARKKATARERGYVPRSEAAASLRALANSMDMEAKDGATSLVKMTLNCWFTPDDELQAETAGSQPITKQE